MALLALLALLLGALALSLLLQRKLREEPYVRERPPLQPPTKREPTLSSHPAGSVSMVSTHALSIDSSRGQVLGCCDVLSFSRMSLVSHTDIPGASRVSWVSPQFLETLILEGSEVEDEALNVWRGQG